MKHVDTNNTWELIRDLSVVLIIHLSGGYIITRYLTTHTQTKSLVVTIFGLMVLLYFLSAEKKTVQIFKSLWKYTREQFSEKKNLIKMIKQVGIGLGMTAILFSTLELGAISKLYTVPKESLHTVSLLYIFVSVPIQQLLFFILPERITESRLHPIILSAIAIPFFGMVHGYYPNFITILITGATLGIVSSYLVFYKRNYYASIITHMIAGSIALTIGLV